MSQTSLRPSRRRFMTDGGLAIGALPLFVSRASIVQASDKPGTASAPSQVNSLCPETDHQRQLREDFPWLARYAADNEEVRVSHVRPLLVMIGDSITEGWQRIVPGNFGDLRICRGIGGQTTPQMLLRMMQDVISLRPVAVHIMGGTNDIAANTGPMTLEQTAANVEAMTIVAHSYGIKVLIASVPPAGGFHWAPDKQPAEPIRKLNALLRNLAAHRGTDWVDYYSQMADSAGAMRPGLSSDGVHPLESGYAVMEGVLAPHLLALND